jgi:hypothetical protein
MHAPLTSAMRFILSGACFVALVGCHPGAPATPIAPTIQTATPLDEAEMAPKTFLENCQQLRASDGFRQNVWLNSNQDGLGAICMDLDHQLYLVVVTSLPARPVAKTSKQFRQLRISTAALRQRMDPDAFILNRYDNDPIRGIFRIPVDAGESFAVDLCNEILNLKLQPGGIGFGWD